MPKDNYTEKRFVLFDWDDTLFDYNKSEVDSRQGQRAPLKNGSLMLPVLFWGTHNPNLNMGVSTSRTPTTDEMPETNAGRPLAGTLAELSQDFGVEFNSDYIFREDDAFAQEQNAVFERLRDEQNKIPEENKQEFERLVGGKNHFLHTAKQRMADAGVDIAPKNMILIDDANRNSQSPAKAGFTGIKCTERGETSTQYVLQLAEAIGLEDFCFDLLQAPKRVGGSYPPEQVAAAYVHIMQHDEKYRPEVTETDVELEFTKATERMSHSSYQKFHSIMNAKFENSNNSFQKEPSIAERFNIQMKKPTASFKEDYKKSFSLKKRVANFLKPKKAKTSKAEVEFLDEIEEMYGNKQLNKEEALAAVALIYKEASFSNAGRVKALSEKLATEIDPQASLYHLAITSPNVEKNFQAVLNNHRELEQMTKRFYTPPKKEQAQKQLPSVRSKISTEMSPAEMLSLASRSSPLDRDDLFRLGHSDDAMLARFETLRNLLTDQDETLKTEDRTKLEQEWYFIAGQLNANGKNEEVQKIAGQEVAAGKAENIRPKRD